MSTIKSTGPITMPSHYGILGQRWLQPPMLLAFDFRFQLCFNMRPSPQRVTKIAATSTFPPWTESRSRVTRQMKQEEGGLLDVLVTLRPRRRRPEHHETAGCICSYWIANHEDPASSPDCRLPPHRDWTSLEVEVACRPSQNKLGSKVQGVIIAPSFK